MRNDRRLTGTPIKGSQGRSPHLGRLNDRTTYAMGYNGLGVAMASNMGKYVAEVVTGGKPSLGMVTESVLKTIPFYSLREPGVRMIAGWYQLLDKLGY
ncbi:hypothetical protein [Pseudomonas sp. Kh13]|uniref:hypothetical protein n=1 Tax=Pseudomonas sp. Kh13 TaxID=2093744 RepID=UPI0021154B29|nr:hypothetical protein [Pseudomonas sp. Kh13]